MQKICILDFYVGKLPDYFTYFIASCERNPTIDFFIFTDTIKETQKIKNVNLIPLTFKEFNQLASERLNLTIDLKRTIKIPELKPAFGVLFSEYISSYDFWGWCDIDVIWGNMRNFLTEELLSRYDVIVPKEKWTAGHFMLFRNMPINNRIFECSPTYKKTFTCYEYTAFEESCHRWQGEFYFIDYLHKKNMLVSLYDIIRNLEHENKLKVHYKNIVKEHPDPIHHSYRNGSWYDQNNEEFMYFHLLVIKKIWRFYIPKWKHIPDDFIASPKGIFSIAQSALLNKLLWSMQRALFCSKGIFYSSRNQKPLALAIKAFKEIKKVAH